MRGTVSLVQWRFHLELVPKYSFVKMRINLSVRGLAVGYSPSCYIHALHEERNALWCKHIKLGAKFYLIFSDTGILLSSCRIRGIKIRTMLGVWKKRWP